MPQLQPGDFAPQLFWLAIIFALFYLALSRLALPRITEVIEARKAKIEGDLKDAREAQAKAQREAERYDAKIAAAKATSQANILAHRAKLDAELNGKRGELDRQLAAKAAETEKSIRQSLEQASGELEAMTAGVVAGIVKELAGVEANADEVRAALRQSAKE